MPHLELQPIIDRTGRLIMRTFTGSDLETTRNYWTDVRQLIEHGNVDILKSYPNPLIVRDSDGEPHELTTNINRLIRQLDSLTQTERHSVTSIDR